MKTLVAKLEEMRVPLLTAIQSNAMDSHLAVEKLTILDAVSKMVHGHIGECAISFHGENVVVLGDLDSESGQCVTSSATPEQVEDMHSEAQEAAKQFAALLSFGVMIPVEPEYKEIATPALDRLGYFSQVEIMVEEIQKGDMSAVDLISEMRDAFVDRHHGMTIFEITSAETLDLMLAIEEIEAICEYLEIRLDPRKTHDEWSAEFDQEAGGPDFGQEVIASDFIHGILGVSLNPVSLQTLLDPVPEYQVDELVGLPVDYSHQIYGCGVNDVLAGIFLAMSGPIDPLRERYNELLDQKAALQADHDSTDSDNIHFIAARANIRHTIGEIDRELGIIKQDL